MGKVKYYFVAFKGENRGSWDRLQNFDIILVKLYKVYANFLGKNYLGVIVHKKNVNVL